MTTNANECRECAFAQASYRKGSQDFPTCLAHRTTNATHTPLEKEIRGLLFQGLATAVNEVVAGYGAKSEHAAIANRLRDTMAAATVSNPARDAAPELLETLEALVPILESVEVNDRMVRMWNWENVAGNVRAAIRKARGA